MGGGKGASSTVTVHNGPVTVDADSTVEVVGLNDIKLTLQPTPFKTESKQELVLPQPLKTESKLDTTSDIDSKSAMSIDLKPVALDVCLNTSSKLPQGQICQPYSHHLGLTMFGIEVFGLNFSGEARTLIQDVPKKPAVEWPAQQNAAPAASPYSGASPGSASSSGGRSFTAASERGLRVRIK